MVSSIGASSGTSQAYGAAQQGNSLIQQGKVPFISPDSSFWNDYSSQGISETAKIAKMISDSGFSAENEDDSTKNTNDINNFDEYYDKNKDESRYKGLTSDQRISKMKEDYSEYKSSRRVPINYFA